MTRTEARGETQRTSSSLHRCGNNHLRRKTICCYHIRVQDLPLRRRRWGGWQDEVSEIDGPTSAERSRRQTICKCPLRNGRWKKNLNEEQNHKGHGRPGELQYRANEQSEKLTISERIRAGLASPRVKEARHTSIRIEMTKSSIQHTSDILKR